MFGRKILRTLNKYQHELGESEEKPMQVNNIFHHTSSCALMLSGRKEDEEKFSIEKKSLFLSSFLMKLFALGIFFSQV
jgi:hypothetical protein